MLTRQLMWSLRSLRNQNSTFLFSSAKGPNLQTDFSQILASSNTKQKPTNGRSWHTSQLRLKSNEDLHKLWFMCVKQKNLLLADQVVQQKFSESKVLYTRIQKVKKTMNRILGVVRQRQNIKKVYRKKLEDEYVEKKRQELREKVSKQEEKIPQITWNMLREKYLALRKGVDNVKYLQRIWEKKDEIHEKVRRMQQRLKTNKPKKFSSFWDYQMSIGQRPLQEQVLRAHIKNWRSLNLKQRKIILGFLNARRSKDAKASFVKELRILGDKIAQDQIKSRVQTPKAEAQKAEAVKTQ